MAVTVQTLKIEEAGERSIPIRSQLLKRIKEYLPEALTNNSDTLIWSDDYIQERKAWGNNWVQTFTRHYKFTSHTLRSYVITQLLRKGCSPYYLFEIS